MTPEYYQQYIIVGVLIFGALGMGILPLVLAKFVAPKKPNPTKQAPYECGMEASGDPWVQFNVQYYIYALLFVIFDVEILFILPWALVWRNLGIMAFIEMILFIAILGVGLAYAWRKGALEWD